jgi:hypothetical protein
MVVVHGTRMDRKKLERSYTGTQREEEERIVNGDNLHGENTPPTRHFLEKWLVSRVGLQ